VKVFLSWSGETGLAVARVFADLLPVMFEDVKPFVSSEIEKGKRWNSALAEELRDTSYGIICLTRAGLHSDWLLFEAGALSKLDTSRVSTFLLGLKQSEVKSPLADFQATLHDEVDVKKLVKSVNANLERPRADANLDGTWRLWWPDFKRKIDQLETQAKQEIDDLRPEAGVSSQDTLEEILGLAREQQRLLNSPEVVLPPDYLMSVLRAKSREEMEDRRRQRTTILGPSVGPRNKISPTAYAKGNINNIARNIVPFGTKPTVADAEEQAAAEDAEVADAVARAEIETTDNIDF